MSIASAVSLCCTFLKLQIKHVCFNVPPLKLLTDYIR